MRAAHLQDRRVRQPQYSKLAFGSDGLTLCASVLLSPGACLPALQGLSSYVYTSSLSNMLRSENEIMSGNVLINGAAAIVT